MKLYRWRPLRRIAMPVLKWVGNRDISITHPYTKDRFTLHAFRHKGYWYHGARREKTTMMTFQSLIPPGATVVEVGGHIGYISTYFAKLVGDSGRVYVFEPGENNLPYIRKNLEGRANVTLVEKALSKQSGTTTFYIDDLTGQNNSLVSGYSTLTSNRSNAFVHSSIQEVEVETVRYDEYAEANDIVASFVKIDVEGAELMVLDGMQETLRIRPPILMVEVTENKEAVRQLLLDAGYTLFHDDLTPWLATSLQANVFALHSDRHASLIAQYTKQSNSGRS